MNPAACYGQVFLFFFQSVVNLVTVCYADAGIVLQEFPWVGSVPGLLEFIKNNLLLPVQISGTVYPHPAFGACGPSVFVYEEGRFVHHQKSSEKKLAVEVIIHRQLLQRRFTMVEMAKAYALNLCEYLKFVLEHRSSKTMTAEDLANLAPWSETVQQLCKNKME